MSFHYVPVWQMAWNALTSVAFRIAPTGVMMIMSSLTMTMTMRTAMAGEGLVMKYRVVSKEVELVTGKNLLVLLNQLLRITCASCSYSTSQQVYQQAGFSLLVKLMLESYKTSMIEFL